MPTQPARPVPKSQPDNEQNLKKWVIIGAISIGVFVGGFFALNALMTEERGGSALLEPRYVDSKPAKKEPEQAPVALAARPIRLFDEYVKAIHRNDKKMILAYSEVDESKIDLLLEEERRKIVTESLSSNPRRWKITDTKIEPPAARMEAVFENGRGFPVMGLGLTMRQRTGAEDWVVTRIDDQWYAASGKMPESRFVELGGDRKTAASPLKEANTFSSMPEAEPKQLDWLPGTTEVQKAEIERHIRDLFDEKNPAKGSSASQHLTDLGKNAVPKLLSEFVGLDIAKSDTDIKKGNAVDRTLAVMTDLEMGYDPGNFQTSGALPPAQGRMRAIRRWFGWWNKSKDLPLPQRHTEGK